MAVGSQHRIASLDGLRGISVALVLLAHGGVSMGAPRWLHETYSLANIGVRVFFVISGYLITHLLLTERARTGEIDLAAFYVRRSFRILPAAYVYMAIVIVACWSSLSGVDVASSVLYLANYHEHHAWVLSHLWSLGVEEQFYLLWPLLLVLLFARRRAVLGAALALSPLVRAGLMVAFALRVPLVSMQSVTFWFPSVADALATGCLLAVVRPELERRARTLGSRWMLLVPLATLALVQVQRIDSRYTGIAYQVLVIPLIHVGIALTVDHCVRARYRVLNAGPLRWSGLASYSLYLWQQPFLESTVKLTGSAGWWQRYPLNFALSAACGFASYYLVEQPVLRYRERRAAARRELAGRTGPTLRAANE
jgi:peptidoglycan/LPS O-acetylase OafA/YrhL